MCVFVEVSRMELDMKRQVHKVRYVCLLVPGEHIQESAHCNQRSAGLSRYRDLRIIQLGNKKEKNESINNSTYKAKQVADYFTKPTFACVIYSGVLICSSKHHSYVGTMLRLNKFASF